MRSLRSALVVGGAGFFGSWLVEALLDAGAAVAVLDSLERGRREALPAAAELLVGDAVSADLDAVLSEREVDVVFQLAGTGLVPASLEHPLDDLRRNAETTVAVLEAARRASTPPLVGYVSSAAVYGEGVRMPMDESHPVAPVSPYGISKLTAERYVAFYARHHGVPGFSIRPFSLYGPRQRKLVVYDLARRVLEGENPLVVAAVADVSRDFVYVGDAAASFVKVAGRARGEGEAYNFAAGAPTTLGDLAAAIVDAAGCATGVRFNGSLRPGDPLRWHGDASRAAALGARFDMPLADGLARTVAWLREEVSSDAAA